MNFFSKSIIISILLFFVASCHEYLVGNIKVEKHDFKSVEGFNYIKNYDRFIMKGKIDNEIFVGDIQPVEVMRKIERKRFPDVKSSTIRKANKFAFTRLTGSRGRTVECFIRQASPKYFRLGGRGRCYMLETRQEFDIIIAKKNLYAFI